MQDRQTLLLPVKVSAWRKTSNPPGLTPNTDRGGGSPLRVIFPVSKHWLQIIQAISPSLCPKSHQDSLSSTTVLSLLKPVTERHKALSLGGTQSGPGENELWDR